MCSAAISSSARCTLDGEQHGFHWWNRLPDGTEIDLTRDQFRLGQTVTAGRTVTRPAGRPRRRAEEYELLGRRVRARLAGCPMVAQQPAEPDMSGATTGTTGRRATAPNCSSTGPTAMCSARSTRRP
ncbi:YunG family protein [Streptomyces sp. NPDC054847]